MDDLENQRQLLQQAMEEFRRSGSVTGESLERMAKAANLTDTEAKKLAKSFGQTSSVSSDLKNSLKYAGQQAQQAGRDLSSLAKGLLDSQSEFASLSPAFNLAGQAATLAGKGVGKFTESLGDGIQSLGMMFKNPLVMGAGAILGGAVKGIGKAADAVIEKTAGLAVQAANFYVQMMESYMATYKRAGQFGIAAASGLTGLTESSNRSRLSLDSFVAQISKHSQDLAFSFGNTAAGAYRLSQMQNQMRKSGVERQFRNLGLGLEEQNDILATTTKIQTMTNRSQIKDTVAMSASAEAFGKQLILLSKLTGQSVESLQNKINEDLRSERFGTYLASLEAEQAKDFMAAGALLSRFGPGIEKGFKDAVAGFQTEDARKFFAATGGLGQDILEDFKQTRDVGVFANRIRDSLASTAMAVSGGDLKRLAQLGDAGTVLGGNINALVRATKDRDVDYNEFLPQVRQEIERLGQTTDPTTKNLTAAAEAVTDAKLEIQNAFLKTLPKASQYLNFFADTVKKSIDSVGDLIEEIQRLTGKKDTVNIEKPGYERGQKMTTARRREKLLETLTKEERKKLYELAKKELIAEGKHKYGQVQHADQIAKAAELVDQGRFMGAYQQGSQSLLDFIAQKESGGSYTKLVGGEEKQDLTGMTVGQILEFQKNMVKSQTAGGLGLPSSAVGKYQIINDTLESLVKQGIVTKEDLFSTETQDRLGKALLQRRGYDEYAAGKLSADEFADRLAKEWAALPTATGKSYYEGTNGNRSLVSRDELIAVLKDVPRMAVGGVTSGVSIAGERGPEAVVPLPDGRTIPVQIQNSGLFADKDIKRIYDQIGIKEIVNNKTAKAFESNRDGSIKISLSDALAKSEYMPGVTEFGGINQGFIKTDLKTVAKIAESLGAFDQSTKTITDPEVWKKILPIGTMYDMGGVSYGAPAIPGITQEIINEIVKLREQGNTKDQALTAVVQDLKLSLQTFYSRVDANGNTEQLSRLDELVNLMRSSNDLSGKMLRQTQ